MADLKISQLPAGSVPAGANIFPVVQTGTTNQVTITQLFTSPTLVTPALGTPASGTLSGCTGYPTANLTGAGTGVLAALANNTGSAGSVVVNGGALGTPASGTLSGCSAYPTATLTGDGTGVLAGDDGRHPGRRVRHPILGRGGVGKRDVRHALDEELLGLAVHLGAGGVQGGNSSGVAGG